MKVKDLVPVIVNKVQLYYEAEGCTTPAQEYAETAPKDMERGLRHHAEIGKGLQP